MPKRPPDKVPIPTDAEMNDPTIKTRELWALSAKNKGQFLYLRLSFRTGGTGLLVLDPTRADYVLRTLKKFLPNSGDNDGSPQKWAGESLEDQQGHLPNLS
jgi:hypothetical protein